MVDLQMHSNFSDGSQSPYELVEEAEQLGLTAIALTDHDTIEGIPEFIAAAKNSKVIAVPGVEISIDTKLPHNGHMHMLGLFIDHENVELKEKLDYLRYHRNERALQIIQKLNALGAEVSMDELMKEAGEGSIGRPHIAKILVHRGVVSTFQEAFDKFLAKGKPAYVDKIKFDEANAIQLIKKAGGLAILAHPHLMNYETFEECAQKILQLKEMELDGFEVYYSGLARSFTDKLIYLAESNDLAISGGSDYHGKNKEHIRMGFGRGDLNIPDSVYSDLKKRWSESFQKPIAVIKK
jgi:predicted metal-dependent phosphoesterase TrpH